MRQTVVKQLALLVIVPVGLIIGAALAGGQDAKKPETKPPAKVKPAEKHELDEMLAEALKNNPDIRLAEAKLAEAQAELNRTRLEVTRKLTVLKSSLSQQKGLVHGRAQAKEDVLQRYRSARVTAAEVLKAELELNAAKAKLGELEAEIPYLLGRSSSVGSWKVIKLNRREHFAFSPDGKVLSAGELRLWDATTGKALSAPSRSYPVADIIVPIVPTSMADRIRKALDTPVKVNYKQKKFPDILADLGKKMPGVLIQSNLNFMSSVPTMDLEVEGEIPLGAALQSLLDKIDGAREVIRDESPEPIHVVLVVRDYGILFALKPLLPEGAVLLNDFWKSKPAEWKKPETEKKPASK